MYTDYDFENKSHFLFLRGHFEDKFEDENSKVITGIDSIIRWDYMGAAEYEFGAVPESLKRMVNLWRENKLKFLAIKIKDEDFVLVAPDSYETVERVSKIESILNNLAKNEYCSKRRPKYSVKMGTHFYSYYLGPTITRIKKGCKKKTETVANYSFCNFWWDIEGDYMFFPLHHEVIIGHPADNKFITTSSYDDLILAFKALDEKGYGQSDVKKTLIKSLQDSVKQMFLSKKDKEQ